MKPLLTRLSANLTFTSVRVALTVFDGQGGIALESSETFQNDFSHEELKYVTESSHFEERLA